MPVTCWLHIGLHKTATTFLQQIFAHHRESLATRGFLYPFAGIPVLTAPSSRWASQGHAGLVKAVRRPKLEASRTVIAELEREIEGSGAETVFLSSELFGAPRNLRLASALVETIGRFGRPKVLLYLRRQDFWLESFYREILRWPRLRERRTIDEFARSEDGRAWLDFSARIEIWRRAVGPDALFIRSFDDAMAGKGVLGDLCDVVGLEEIPSTDVFAGETVNASLDAGLVDLLRAANEDERLIRADRVALVRALAEATPPPAVAGRSDARAAHSMIDDALWTELAGRYRDENERLAAEAISGAADRLMFPAERPMTEPTPSRLSRGEARAIFDALLANREIKRRSTG